MLTYYGLHIDPGAEEAEEEEASLEKASFLFEVGYAVYEKINLSNKTTEI